MEFKSEEAPRASAQLGQPARQTSEQGRFNCKFNEILGRKIIKRHFTFRPSNINASGHKKTGATFIARR
jgi:hypothetical protein